MSVYPVRTDVTSLPQVNKNSSIDHAHEENQNLIRFFKRLALQLTSASTFNSKIQDLHSQKEKAEKIRTWIKNHTQELTTIQQLNLSFAGLTGLPTEIGQLQALEYLDLINNRLTSLPIEIGQLKNLIWLFLTNNRLASLPTEIGQLQALKELSITGNQLKSFPIEIRYLQRLKWFHCHDNPLSLSQEKLKQLLPPALCNNPLSHFTPKKNIVIKT